MGECTAVTMGMQILNDPNFGGVETGNEVNAKIMSDLFVVAEKDIKKGEEIFLDYNLADGSNEDTREGSQDNEGKEPKAVETDGDEESNSEDKEEQEFLLI
jgi:SET domain-containing protein